MADGEESLESLRLALDIERQLSLSLSSDLHALDAAKHEYATSPKPTGPLLTAAEREKLALMQRSQAVQRPISYYRTRLQAHQSALGFTHPCTLVSLQLLALRLSQCAPASCKEEAIALYTAALEGGAFSTQEAVLGVALRLVSLQDSLRRPKAALALCSDALAACAAACTPSAAASHPTATLSLALALLAARLRAAAPLEPLTAADTATLARADALALQALAPLPPALQQRLAQCSAAAATQYSRTAL